LWIYITSLILLVDAEDSYLRRERGGPRFD
jgi:hypothetical protein